MNASLLRLITYVLVLSAASLPAGSAWAQGERDRRPDTGEARPDSPGRREQFMQLTPEQRQLLHERRQARGERGGGPPSDERREAMRQRWQEMTPAERQQLVEKRRQLRQLSPEERQQLRRDVLEAYRGPR